MYSIALRHDEHTRKYRVTPGQQSGWELTMTEDLKPAKTVKYQDWHRVERAVARFTRQIAELRQQGWHEAGTPT